MKPSTSQSPPSSCWWRANFKKPNSRSFGAVLMVLMLSQFAFAKNLHMHEGKSPSQPLCQHAFATASMASPALNPIAQVVLPGTAIPLTDTIEVCQDDITRIAGDVAFDIRSIFVPSANSIIRYTIQNVVVNDPNFSPLAPDVLTTIWQGWFPMNQDGVAGSAFTYNFLDALLLFPEVDFVQPATVTYTIVANVLDLPAFTQNPGCLPETYQVNVKVWPSPRVQATTTNGQNHVCSTGPVSLTANVLANLTPTSSFAWSVLSADPGVSGSFSNNFSQNTTFTPTLNTSIIPKGGSGTVQLLVQLSDGNGCSGRDTLALEVFRSLGTLACNDLVYVSLDEDCSAIIDPDQVLEGSYGNYDLFDVVIFDRGRNIGNQVNGSHIGRTLQVRVIDRCSGNYCWGNMIVEDKMPPQLDCRSNLPVRLLAGSIDNADPTFNRTATFPAGTDPAFCIPSAVGTSVRYETFIFTIPAAGFYTFDMVSTSIPDAFGALYINSFDPSQPCLNLLVADDDGHIFPAPTLPGPRIEIELFLAPGKYVLVTTTFANGQTGNYQWNVDAPALPNGSNPGVMPMMPGDTIMVTCADDLSAIPPPIVIDNCDHTATVQLIGEDYADFGCGRADGTVRIVERTWRAKDKYNNSSATCKQIIKVIRQTLDAVDFPPDYDGMSRPALDCAKPMSAAHPDSTGWPTINGSPLLAGNLCKINVGYRDVVLPICGSSKKILREWTVLDWCLPLIPGVNPLTHTQLIKFMDSKPPRVVCPADTIIASTDANICTATVLFPPIQATDDCSGVIVQITTPFGVVHGNGGVLSGFPIGDYNITYTVRDSCGNQTTCVRTLRVTDLVEPVAVCVEFLTASLTTGGGISDVFATSIDAGSYDNCCIEKFEVKRMGAPDSAFGPYVRFDCDDAGRRVMVIMRVWDCFGNFNTCMVEIDVQDKLPPNLTCPPNRTLSCKQNKDDLSVTGRPTAVDACPILRLNYMDDDRRNRCGVGRINRTFLVEDTQGNRRTCLQVLTFVNDHPADPITFKWPKDTTFVNDCGRGLDPDDLPKGYDYPTFPDTFCAELLYSYDDEIFSLSPPACFKLVRTWTIIDWCTYTGNGTTGKWTHKQTIKVLDNQAPVLTCQDTIFAKVGPNCRTSITIDTPAVADCSPNIEFTVSGNLTNQLGTVSNVTVGNYTVTITARDGCRNSASCTFPVIVRDSTEPSPICKSISAELNDMGEVVVWAKDLDASSYDNCTPRPNLIFSFSPNPANQSRKFTCDDIGPNLVTVWVIDEYGNKDFCVDTVTVQDNMMVCGSGSRPAVAGAVHQTNGEAVDRVQVSLSGHSGSSATTTGGGKYAFPNLQRGADYSVYPHKDDDPLNGVTTYDLVLISKHVLNESRLTSPYQLIAADANNSKSITTLDIVVFRKLILRLIDELPNNTSWRFVDAGYTFPQPANPWQERFPEVRNINNLNANLPNVNFVAVKIGDVNGNARSNSLSSVEPRSTAKPLLLEVEDAQIDAGKEVEVSFLATEFAGVLGYQFTLQFDPARMELTDISAGETSKREHFGTGHTDKGFITASWHTTSPKTLGAGAVLFRLKFKALTEVALSKALRLNGALTTGESYLADGTQIGVALQFRGAHGLVSQGSPEFELLQNEPNPFDRETVVRFILPEPSEATLTVTDAGGKVLHVVQQKFEAGRNEVKLTRDELKQSGVLFYRLQTPRHEAIRKMILLNRE